MGVVVPRLHIQGRGLVESMKAHRGWWGNCRIKKNGDVSVVGRILRFPGSLLIVTASTLDDLVFESKA